MKHAIRITQPAGAGSTVITFDAEGPARATVEGINGAGDDRTAAEYLGKCSTTPLTFAPGEGVTLRSLALGHYAAALPHRVAFDVLGMTVSADLGEATCLVLGGWAGGRAP